MVRPHQDAQREVEDHPSGREEAEGGAAAGETDGGEDEGYRGEEEAGLLVLEDGEDDDAGYGGVKA